MRNIMGDNKGVIKITVTSFIYDMYVFYEFCILKKHYQK